MVDPRRRDAQARRMSTRLYGLSLFVTMLLATRFTGCGSETGVTTTGSTTGDTMASSSSGDPNPPMMCNGPGKGESGDPCATACDCCALDCRVLTALDGGMSGVCASDCPTDAGIKTRD